MEATNHFISKLNIIHNNVKILDKDLFAINFDLIEMKKDVKNLQKIMEKNGKKIDKLIHENNIFPIYINNGNND